MIVTYIERYFVDKFTCIHTTKKINAISYFIQGGLYYFKVNPFEYKVIENDCIKSIDCIQE